MKLVHFVLQTTLALSCATAWGAATEYPMTISNCGENITLQTTPDSVVTIGQSATEILYALGVANKVKGTSVWFNPVLSEFRDVNTGIDRIADNDPSFEAIVNKKPALVAAQYELHVGPMGTVATRNQFNDLGIKTYILPSDCDTKNNATGGDGTRTGAFSTNSIYKGISELARIFNVQDMGNRLLRDLKSREAKAIELAHSLALPKNLSAIFWFSSPTLTSGPYVAGKLGAPGYMMNKLGIENVVQSNEEWPTVSWESIAKADPDIIVVATMDRRRYPADDVKKKFEFLRTDPVTKEMKAVKSGHVVEMDALAMSATMRTIYGLEALSNALSKMHFAQ